MVRCFCTFNVVLIVIPTMFPLCNFLAKDAILVVKPYVCFTTKIFDIFALWFISFLSISFSDVIVLRSIWSTWVTKDTIQGAKRVLITLSGGGWSRVHYLRNDPSCFLRPSSRSPREVFFAPRLSILFDWKLRVEGMNDESKLPHNNSDRSTTAPRPFYRKPIFSPCSLNGIFSPSLSPSFKISYILFFLFQSDFCCDNKVAKKLKSF